MGTFIRKHPGAAALSIAMHVALLAAFTVDLPFAPHRRAAAVQSAIKATVVDTAAVEREVERIEQAERAEAERREREAREAAEQARREREAEEQRLAEERRQREEAEREEQRRQIALKEQREREAREQREREAAAAREQERLAEEKRQRDAEERRKAEEERKRREEEERQRLQAEADARKQAELEAELSRALEAESARREAEQAGLLDEYIRLIQNKIERSWIKPPSARPGLECVINVTQIPSGDVVNVGFGRCNADDAVKRSIEAAVLRASPLPKPPVPALFSRSLEITFRPEA